MEASVAARPVLIRMDGVFDVPAAQRLARTIAQEGSGTALEIDLTDVREFHDFGVTVLANALARAGGHTAVRGLRQHHRRLLRYLGIDTGADVDLGAEIESA